MKKMTRNSFKSLVFSLLASSFLLFSCMNDIDSASTTAGLDNSGDDSVVLTDNDGKSDKDTRKDYGSSGSGSSVIDFGDDFIRGFDASAVDYFENVYVPAHSDWNIVTKCSDSDGSKDIFALLADHGFNTIRLRVWVDPSVTDTISNDAYWPTSTDGENWHIGDCTVERATRLAKRAKTAGMKVLLDLHLSDYWTDPSVQLIPKSWQDITTADAMAKKLSSYITETLQYMKDADATPDYVQVGNEIDRGILVDKSVNAGTTPNKTPSEADPSIKGYYNTENFKTYLKAGCDAVRDFDNDIKIIVHMTAKNTERLSNVTSSGADFDIIGLSYYAWEDHGTISELKEKIGTFKATKDVWVVETSAPYAQYKKGDSTYIGHMTQAATNLGSGYDDVTITDGKLVPSEAVQKAILRHTMQEVYAAGGKGICVWGGERRDYQYGLFDWNGKAYAAIDAFNYKPSGGYTTEDASDDDTGGDSKESYDEMTLKFDFPESLSAGTISVLYYKADGASSSGKTVDATVTDNSASVTLSSEYATDWGFNAKITVKNTSGTDITSNVGLGTWTSSVSGGATNAGGDCEKSYFAFTKDSTLTVVCTDKSEAPTVSMSLVLDFSAVSGVTSVSGEYYKANSSEKTTIASTNLSSSKATITISGKYSDGDWINVEITPTGGSFQYNTWTSSATDGATDAGGNTENNKCWFKFYKDSTLTATLKAVDTGGGD